MSTEQLVLNDLDEYCCVCGWWHYRYADIGHEPLVTLDVYDEILRWQREVQLEDSSRADAG